METRAREHKNGALTRHPEGIFGLRFCPAGTQALADHLAHTPPPLHGAAEMLFTANLDHIVKMRSNGAFRAAYDRASFVTADGMPVYFYARWRGVPLPERVTGADLFPALMVRLDPDMHRPFFVVSDEETAGRIGTKLAQRGFEDAQVIVPPFGFEADEAYSSQLAQRIAALGTTHLLFCVGAPKSELWLDRHRDVIGPCYAMALGAGANFFAGTAQRAPRLMRSFGAEWLWRFLCEPRRLFRRYFIDSWAFLLAIADDLRGKTSS
ncbi:WecB/TagA/CpsF family glycosyltransferase [Chelativorans sp. M5D2P16]|uniref:WecB/TagA/CpsF family glycosyltransferase n=1 Tax=Chelativorans sp. M5D2P16 TaxID=3095678 RepID=UPI002ACAC0DD|nr:WecB/TagA/CpsF family glycosyltransferase [Chelativorans sp. M5D2P16]MDZ5698895.1 WecB/TagA/CpsF family glycosyltransferase [Chelativorans sp. M5D2P16]